MGYPTEYYYRQFIITTAEREPGRWEYTLRPESKQHRPYSTGSGYPLATAEEACRRAEKTIDAHWVAKERKR